MTKSSLRLVRHAAWATVTLWLLCACGGGSGLIAAVAPLISMQPADASVLAPATASFSVTVLGVPPFTYLWEKSDDGGTTFGPAPGVNSAATYTTPATSVAADHGDRYRVTVSSDSDGDGVPEVARSSTVTLTVTAVLVAPTITTQPQSASAAVGSTASFSVIATGTDLVYQWRRNGAPIVGQTNASLNLNNLQAGDAGDYSVEVSNLVGGTPINGVVSGVATLTVTTPPSASTTPKVAAASQHSLALARNGTVYSWGLNTLNELGRVSVLSFDTQAAPIPALANVIDIATAGNTSLALLADGTVRSWGSNGRGLLGIGTTTVTAGVQTVSGLFGVTRIAMGGSHALALRNDGTVWAWGANVSGAIGDGSKIDRTTAVRVSGLSNVIAIAGGGSNSFALRADGTVWVWGENSTSPLLLGQGGSGADQLTPIQVQAVTGAVALEASETNAFARTATGQMWAWGQGVPGVFDPTTSTLLPQLLTNLPVPASTTSGTCWVVTSVNPLGYLLIAQASGVLSGFGAAETPAGGLAVLTGVTDVSAVYCHALALRGDGTVWATGLNNAGQLGDGTITPRNLPVQVLGLNLH